MGRLILNGGHGVLVSGRGLQTQEVKNVERFQLFLFDLRQITFNFIFIFNKFFFSLENNFMILSMFHHTIKLWPQKKYDLCIEEEQHQNTTLPEKIIFQKLVFKSSLLLNG